MEEEKIVNTPIEEQGEELEIQNNFNEDGLDVLVEEGSVENEYKND